MKINPPILPAALTETADLESAVQYARQEEDDVRGLLFRGGSSDDLRLHGPLEFRGCVFENWRFSACAMQGIGLVDVIFRNCDLSNLDLTGCSVMRCTLMDCKAVGLLLPQAKLRHFRALDCQMRMANLSGCKCKAASFTRCDLSGAVLLGCELQCSPFDECRLVGCNVSGTSFGGIDLTTCEVEGWQLGGGELRGAIVTRDQAADFSRLLGLTIRA